MQICAEEPRAGRQCRYPVGNSTHHLLNRTTIATCVQRYAAVASVWKTSPTDLQADVRYPEQCQEEGMDHRWQPPMLRTQIAMPSESASDYQGLRLPSS